MDNRLQSLTESIVHIDDAYDRWAKRNDMSYSTLMVLYCLHDSGPCTQKHIASDCALPKQTVNTVLAGLRKKGYIRLEAGVDDRREKLVVLNEAGREYAAPIIMAISRCERAALDSLSPDDQRHLVRTTRLFADAFDEAVDRG